MTPANSQQVQCPDPTCSWTLNEHDAPEAYRAASDHADTHGPEVTIRHAPDGWTLRHINFDRVNNIIQNGLSEP